MTPTTKSRRESLEAFVEATPNDAFARYGLALECVKLGDDAAAQEHFKQLIAANPSYVAGYFHYGALLARLARSDEARQILTTGVSVADRSGDTHARDEMQAALDALP
jgi:tetratricopeptide (TPR) repeat protein